MNSKLMKMDTSVVKKKKIPPTLRYEIPSFGPQPVIVIDQITSVR